MRVCITHSILSYCLAEPSAHCSSTWVCLAWSTSRPRILAERAHAQPRVFIARPGAGASQRKKKETERGTKSGGKEGEGEIGIGMTRERSRGWAQIGRTTRRGLRCFVFFTSLNLGLSKSLASAPLLFLSSAQIHIKRAQKSGRGSVHSQQCVKYRLFCLCKREINTSTGLQLPSPLQVCKVCVCVCVAAQSLRLWYSGHPPPLLLHISHITMATGTTSSGAAASLLPLLDDGALQPEATH